MGCWFIRPVSSIQPGSDKASDADMVGAKAGRGLGAGVRRGGALEAWVRTAWREVASVAEREGATLG